MLTIDIYSDVLCPWCWIGKRRLPLPHTEKVGYVGTLLGRGSWREVPHEWWTVGKRCKL